MKTTVEILEEELAALIKAVSEKKTELLTARKNNPSVLETELIQWIKVNPGKGRSEIAKGIGRLPDQTFTNLLLSLRDRKILFSRGNRRSTVWYLVNQSAIETTGQTVFDDSLSESKSITLVSA
jgi:hypothetical protein